MSEICSMEDEQVVPHDEATTAEGRILFPSVFKSLSQLLEYVVLLIYE